MVMGYRTTLIHLCLAVGMAYTAFGAETFLYVANEDAQNISAYSVNSSTGALTPVVGSPFAAGASLDSVAANPTGQFLYAVSADSDAVFAYTIEPGSGVLTAVPGSPFPAGSQPQFVTVDPTGRFVYVANTLGNNISAFAINASSGALTPIAGSPFSAGADPNTVAVDPTGQFVYAANRNSDAISAYTIDQASGALTPVAGSPFPAAALPSQLAVEPTGRYLYVANGSGSLSAYAIAPTTGALTPVSGSPFATQSEPVSIAIDPGGRFTYTATGENSVSAHALDPSTGALVPIPGAPFGAGARPASVAIDFTGKFAYAASGLDNNIWIYAIDQSTGALRAAAGSPFAAESQPASMAITLVNGPTLRVAKSHAGSFTQGQNGVGYTVTVSNSGAAATTGAVTMTEKVPLGLTLTSMAGNGWTCPPGGVVCTRTDALPAGESYPPVAVTMNVTNNALASLTNGARVSGAGSATAFTVDPTTIQVPNLTINSSHSGTFYQGELNATYSITVTNAGSASTSGTVTVEEIVPSGLTLVSLGGNGWTCPSNGPSCTRSDVLTAGTSYPAITVTVNVDSNAPESVTNQAGVSGGGSAAASATDLTIIPQPVLSISSSHTGNFTQGQNGATYSLTVTNGTSQQSSLNVSTSSVSIGSASCNDSQTITLTGATPITFTVAVNYPNGNSHGNWLYAAIYGSGATSTGTTFTASTGAGGVTLTVGLNEALGAVSDTAQVVLTPTNPAGAPFVITVSYSQNTNCATNAGTINNGYISVSPAIISLTATTTGQQSQTLLIQNISGSTYAFTASATASWLSVTPTSSTIPSGGTASVTVTANASQASGPEP